MASAAPATAAAAATTAAAADEEQYIHAGDYIEDGVRYLLPLVAAGPGLPELGIVCGSGLSHLADEIKGDDRMEVAYDKIPGYPKATVKGHSGTLVFGTLNGKKVMCAKGRFHYYEGYEPAKVAVTIRVMAALGCKAVIVTNAAGGVDPKYNVGDVAMIDDHVFFPGMCGNHPLVGPNDNRFGPRFPAINGVYDKTFQKVVETVAAEHSMTDRLHTGAVYGSVSGPSYETPHEIKLLRTIGCTQVGMSTIQEVVVAAHCGLRVLGLSLITNRCLAPGDTHTPPTHEEVLAAVEGSQTEVQKLVRDVVGKLDLSGDKESRGAAYFRKLLAADKK